MDSLTFPPLLRNRLELWSLKAITNKFLNQSPLPTDEATSSLREAAFSKTGKMWALESANPGFET